MGSGGALGARYPPKGAEFFLQIISKLFQHALACIAPLGRREDADLATVQGDLMIRKGQGMVWFSDKDCTVVDDQHTDNECSNNV